MCRVPTFMAAAFVASRTNNVATVPAGVAAELGDAFGLSVFATPTRLPLIEVAQYWHERFHREPDVRRIRHPREAKSHRQRVRADMYRQRAGPHRGRRRVSAHDPHGDVRAGPA